MKSFLKAHATDDDTSRPGQVKRALSPRKPTALLGVWRNEIGDVSVHSDVMIRLLIYVVVPKNWTPSRASILVFQQEGTPPWERRASSVLSFKARVVLEIVSGRKSLALASREYQVKNTVLSRWKAQFSDGAPGIFEAGRPAEEKRLRERIADLERLAGSKRCSWKLQKKPVAT